MKGIVKAPTTKLPPVQRVAKSGKVVVLLSSVAKTPPATSQRLQPLPSPTPEASAPVLPPPKVIPTDSSATARKPPPLPSTPPRPVDPSPPPASPQVSAPKTGASPMPKPVPPQPRLSVTTLVKLPPKTAAPALVSLAGQPLVPVERKEPEKVAPPLLPAKRSEPIKSVLRKTGPIPQAPPLGAATVPAKGDLKKTGPIILNQAPPLTTKGEMKKTGRIVLNPPTVEKPEPEESIFLQPLEKPTESKPGGWKSLRPGELPQPEGGLKDLEVFARSKRLEGAPPPVPKIVEARDKPLLAPPLTPPRTPEPPAPTLKAGPSVVPPRVPEPALVSAKAGPSAVPPRVPEPPPPGAKAVPPVPPPRALEPPMAAAKTEPALNPAPVVLPHAKPAEPAPAHPLHVAPPMVEKAGEEPREKLPPPHLPEPAKSASPEPAPPVQKAPALVEPAAPPAKPLLPPPLPAAKVTENKLKKSAPIVLTALSSQILAPATTDARPALRPAVLPKRAVPVPVEPAAETPLVIGEAKPGASKIEPPAPAKTEEPFRKGGAISAKAPEASSVTTAGKKPGDPVKTSDQLPASPTPTEIPSRAPTRRLTPVVAAGAAGATAVAAAAVAKKPTLPPTRAERAKKRRVREAVIFWVLIVPAAVLILFFGVLHFGRDTRVEGQVIPPDGMSLNDEVWIVTNFSTDASGIADDLAKERTPIQQEIQERRDHVQRAQADIAAREERIRLVQEEIQSAKDEINGIVKKSRDDAQAIWDGEGAQIGQEYDSHKETLRKAIADRAASLKLQYQPDPSFPAPEVWANAYRLALYETPPGVDGVKEHQWLGDQMKQWRDFEKSLDDRKEQLREKAAQLKLEPATKLTDLNSKIDDLNQRIQSTQAEEEPLKAELQQAQADLTAADGADTGLDDKYYKQLYSIPSENITYHISVRPNGRFTWVLDDNSFAGGEQKHRYWIFSRATRADGRQYWALHNFPVERNKTTELSILPASFESTKAILRPNLPPDEQDQ